ncbi:MAG: DUF1572 family protein [Ignavibacteriales bacterium]|nr:DUF1572 family protein [Ignavibacteriales bacterium]
MNTSLEKELIDFSRRKLLQEYFPRIRRCVEELSDDDIWWRAHETDNSIGNLLLHLSGNVRQWIVSGVGGAMDTRKRQEEFDERKTLPKAELLQKLEATLQEVDKTLQHFDTSRLLEKRHIQKYDVTCLEAILHVVEHFSGHVGQIIYITKLRKGVDLKFYNL